MTEQQVVNNEDARHTAYSHVIGDPKTESDWLKVIKYVVICMYVLWTATAQLKLSRQALADSLNYNISHVNRLIANYEQGKLIGGARGGHPGNKAYYLQRILKYFSEVQVRDITAHYRKLNDCFIDDGHKALSYPYICKLVEELQFSKKAGSHIGFLNCPTITRRRNVMSRTMMNIYLHGLSAGYLFATMDETHISKGDFKQVKAYSPVGQPVHIANVNIHISVSCIVCITPYGVVHSTVESKGVGKECIQKFYESVMPKLVDQAIEYGFNGVILCLNNVPSHHAALRAISKIGYRLPIVIACHAVYTPMCNPIELSFGPFKHALRQSNLETAAQVKEFAQKWWDSRKAKREYCFSSTPYFKEFGHCLRFTNYMAVDGVNAQLAMAMAEFESTGVSAPCIEEYKSMNDNKVLEPYIPKAVINQALSRANNKPCVLLDHRYRYTMVCLPEIKVTEGRRVIDSRDYSY